MYLIMSFHLLDYSMQKRTAKKKKKEKKEKILRVTGNDKEIITTTKNGWKESDTKGAKTR